MLLAIDVQYTENTAFVAGICFEDWRSSQPCGEYVSVVNEVAEYQPGFFYRRELPCILKLIEEHDLRPTTIVIDGYVFLDGTEKPGLGKHLHEALNQSVTVIGVAKKAFSGIPEAHALLRGKSQKPLYITTTGNLGAAMQSIATMRGEHRIPVLLKRADQRCREAAKAAGG